MLWKDGLDLDLINWSLNHISMVWRPLGEEEVVVTGFYGQPEAWKREESWELLRVISQDVHSRNWVCFGDFNAIWSNEEKRGGVERTFTHLEPFRQCITNCALVDVGFTGHPFTWTNGRNDEHNIQACLDRCLANDGFLRYWEGTSVQHGFQFLSDHAPLCISIHRSRAENRKKKRKRPLWMNEHLYEDLELEENISWPWRGGGQGCISKIKVV